MLTLTRSCSLPSSINFLDCCKFHLFLSIFRSDYVDTFTCDDAAASLQATVSVIKKMTMSFCNPFSGTCVTMHPDEVFAAYSNLIPLLPFKVSVWGLNLVTQYFDSLSVELQDALYINPLYSDPDLATLVTRSAQLAALRHLRVAPVRQHTMLRNQEKSIAKPVNCKLKHTHPSTALAAPVSVHPPCPPPLATSLPPASSIPSVDASNLAHMFMSPAEEIMRCYQATPSTDAPASFPVDPATNFQCSYPLCFAGCMYCGDSDHVFRQCPGNGTPGASTIFYSNLFAHSQTPPSRACTFAPRDSCSFNTWHFRACSTSFSCFRSCSITRPFHSSTCSFAPCPASIVFKEGLLLPFACQVILHSLAHARSRPSSHAHRHR